MNIGLLMTMKDLTPVKTIFIAGDLVISLVFCIVAFKCASDLGSYSPSFLTGRTTGNAVIPSGTSSDLVITLIYIALGSVAGTMAAHVLLHSGLWGVFFRAWAPDPRDFLSIGAEIGAFIAIIPAPLAMMYRVPLIVGALSSKLGDVFIGDWGSLVITLVTVAITTFIVARQGGRVIHGELWHSVRASWSFSLFGTVGIIAGRLIAIFMLGIYADKLGEAVGGIISSLAGLMASEESWQKQMERESHHGG